MSDQLARYFQVEAGEACEKLAGLAGQEELPGRDAIAGMLAAARTLRGGATMARLTPFAVLAGQLERVLKSVISGRLAWTPLLAETLGGTIDDIAALVPALTHWGPDEDERAHARSAELSRYAAPPRSSEGERIVPIASLFEAGPGPHILYVAVTPQTQFENQLRELSMRSTPAVPAARMTPAGPVARMTPTAQRDAYPAPLPAPVAALTDTPPQRQRRLRTPTSPRGHELRELLEVSATRISADYSPPAPDGELIPIEALVYDSRAALVRARELANAVRATAPDVHPEELAELIDLIELAADR